MSDPQNETMMLVTVVKGCQDCRYYDDGADEVVTGGYEQVRAPTCSHYMSRGMVLGDIADMRKSGPPKWCPLRSTDFEVVLP